MRVLIVGAGAVGQVYGRHLQRAGVEVAFFVKEKHAAEARSGFTMYPLDQGTEPVRFEGFDVLTSVAEVAARSWDQVWLAVSSPALRGAWLPGILGAIEGATLVMLQGGLDDRALVLERWSPERLVTGLIAFIAWNAPLPGDDRMPVPGVAYWLPPLTSSPFSGVDADVAVSRLRAGGLPAKVVEAVQRRSPFPSAALTSHVAALETAGWSFDEVRRSDHLALASAAAHQAMWISARQLGSRPPLAFRLGVRPVAARALLGWGPRLVPFDLEVYLREHFTKVGDQTRQHLRTWTELGKAQGQEVGALVELVRRLEGAR